MDGRERDDASGVPLAEARHQRRGDVERRGQNRQADGISGPRVPMPHQEGRSVLRRVPGEPRLKAVQSERAVEQQGERDERCADGIDGRDPLQVQVVDQERD